MALVVEEDEAPDPAEVGLLCSQAVVAATQAVADQVQQARLEGQFGLGGYGRIGQSALQCGRRDVPAQELKSTAKCLMFNVLFGAG